MGSWGAAPAGHIRVSPVHHCQVHKTKLLGTHCVSSKGSEDMGPVGKHILAYLSLPYYFLLKGRCLSCNESLGLVWVLILMVVCF